MSAASLQIYMSGAAYDGGPQQEFGASLGGFRSLHTLGGLGPRRENPVRGVSIIHAADKNGPGIGRLVAIDADTLRWTATGDTDGAEVSIAQGETVILPSGTVSKWIQVRRDTSADLSGSETVTLCDVRQSIIEIDSVGREQYAAFFLRNEAASAITDLKAWVGSDTDGSIQIAYETPDTDGSIQDVADDATAPTGLTWNSGTTSGTGLSHASLAAGDSLGLWLELVYGADYQPNPARKFHIEGSFVLLAVTHTFSIRGIVSVGREGAAGYYVAIIKDGAPVAFEYAATLPHETTYEPADGAYTIAVFPVNRFGLFTQDLTKAQSFTVTSGAIDDTPPSAVQNLLVGRAANGGMLVTANYEPAPDGANRADLFVVWLSTDGSSIDTGADDPAGFQLMSTAAGNIAESPVAAYETLKYTAALDLLDDTPVSAIVRTRRIKATGATVQCDDGALAATGAGTIETTDSFAAWPASAYVQILSPSSRRREIVYYASRTDTVLNIAEADRAQWGTSLAEGTTDDLVQQVTAVDSADSAEVEATISNIPPSRPRAWAFHSPTVAAAPTPVTGPTTTVVVDAGNSVEWRITPGSTALYVGSTLVFRFIWHSTTGTLYIPSEWTRVFDDVSGAASTNDGVEVVSGTELYLTVNGQRRAKIDLSAMEITLPNLNLDADEIEGPDAPYAVWPRFQDTLFLAWQPHEERWKAFAVLNAFSLFSVHEAVDLTKDQAAVEALLS